MIRFMTPYKKHGQYNDRKGISIMYYTKQGNQADIDGILVIDQGVQG